MKIKIEHTSEHLRAEVTLPIDVNSKVIDAIKGLLHELSGGIKNEIDNIKYNNPEARRDENREIIIEHNSEYLCAKITLPAFNSKLLDEVIEYTVRELLREISRDIETIKNNPNKAMKITKEHRDRLLSRFE